MLVTPAPTRTGKLFCGKFAWINSYKLKSFQKYEKNVPFNEGM